MAELQDLLPRKSPDLRSQQWSDLVASLPSEQAGPAPVLAPITHAAMGGGLKSLLGLPSPDLPDVAVNPRMGSSAADPLTRREGDLNADLYNRTHPTSPTTTGGKIGHIAAGFGNVLGNIFSPATMALIPHTQLYNERMEARDKSDLAQISQLQSQEDQRKQTEANTAYTSQKAGLDRAKVLSTLAGKLAPKGFKPPSFDDEGNLQIEEDPDSQAFKSQQALQALHQSTADKNDALSAIQKNKYVEGTPEYDREMKKIQLAEQTRQLAMKSLGIQEQRLGIQADRLNFDQDKAYNPQPTGAERTKGDLATSAGHYVDVMHEVRQAHPEIFGPAAGRGTQFEAWLGSQDPDAQRYLAASHIAKDHLTAVFGARSKYALEGTGTLFDPKMNNDAFNGQYGDLKNSIDTFQKAGSTHGKGVAGYAATHGITPAPSPQTGPKVGSVEGGYRFKGGNAGDAKNWEKVQ